MLNIIFKILGLLIVLVGVILIFDARMIIIKYFGFGDQNEGSMGLKVIGFILAITGGMIVFLCK